MQTTVQAHQPASDVLTLILRDIDKRHNARRSVFTKIAHASDSIIEEYHDEDKEPASRGIEPESQPELRRRMVKAAEVQIKSG